jgi:hypothetical protein
MGEVTPLYGASLDFLRWAHPKGPWVLVAIKLDKSGIETATFGPSDEVALWDWLERVGEDCNLYWTVNSVTRPMDSKPGRKDIKSLDFLHVDIDPRSGEDLEDEQLAIQERLDGFEPPPSAVIYSGGGYQAFWRLQDPLQIDGKEDAYEDAKRYNVQLERLLGGDNCHNVDRIMRLPGTINRPDEKKLAKGRVEVMATVTQQTDLEYPLGGFTPAPELQNTTGFESKKVKIGGNVPRIEDLSTLPVSDLCKVVIAQGHDTEDPHRWESRSEPLFWVCCEMVRADMTDEQIYAILTDPCWDISGSVLEKGSNAHAYAERQIERAREEAIDPWLCKLNDENAVVVVGGKTRVLGETEDILEGGRKRSRLIYQSFDDFRNFYSNQFIEYPSSDGESLVRVPVGKWWLTHAERRTYNGVVFSPGKSVSGYYNLWKGFDCEAIPGDCGLFLDHVRENICGDDIEVYDYLVRWMATAVQYPAQPGHVAVVMRGRQGTGKGAFANIFGKLWGRHFLAVRDSEHLFGKFNAHLKDCVVLFADEAFWAGDKKREGMLKSMVTEEQMMSERKGYEAELSANYIHLIMASNEGWVVPAGVDDRRFLVLDVLATRMQDVPYFTAINKQMDNGGYEALLHHLMSLDLSEFNVRKVPQTMALREQKMLSLSPEQSWWYSKLLDGRMFEDEPLWADYVYCTKLCWDFISAQKQWNWSAHSSQVKLGIFLKKAMPVLVRAQLSGEFSVTQVNGEPKMIDRPYAYRLPPLKACRQHWDENFGGPYTWPEIDQIPETKVEEPF